MSDENKKACILLVDDDILIAESNKILLRKSGYETVEIACDGKTAIEIAKEKKPDLILMDVNLNSEIDGITAAEEIQKNYDIPFIFVTAYSDTSTIERAKKVGPFGYLIKPFEKRELLVAIETSLYKHSFDKKIKDQEFLFRTISNFAYEWEFWIKPDLEFKYCSPSCERVTGYKAEEFIKNPKLLFDIVHPEDKSKYEEHFKHYHSENYSETVHALELRVINKNGEIKYLRHTCNPIISEDNKFLGRRVTNVDITENKLAEKKLQEREEFLSRVINNVDEIVYSVSFINNHVSGNVDFVSQQVETILGYSPNEFQKTSGLWFSIIHPEDAEEIAKQSKLMFESKKAVNRTYRMKHKITGEYIWIDDHPQILFDNEGNIQGQFGTARDVTERIEAEEALKKSEESHRKLINTVPSGVAVYQDGKFVFINPASLKIMNITNENDLLGKSVLSIVHPDSKKEVIKRMLLVAQGNSVPPFEEKIMRLDGSIFDAEVAATGIIFNNKSAGLVVVQDITERKKVERALKENEEKYRQLFENMNEGVAINEIISDDNGKVIDFKFIDANSAYEVHTGHKPKDIIGKTILEVMPNADKHQIETYGKVVQTGEPLVYEYFSKSFKKYFHVRVFKHSPNRFAVIFQDVTEIKEAEELLKLDAQKFNLLTSTSTDGFWIADTTGKIIEVNEAYCRMIGYSRDEILNKYISDFEANETMEETKKHIEYIIKNNFHRFESRHKCKDDKIINIEVNTNYFKEMNQILVFIHDITQRKNDEDALLKNLNEINRFNNLMIGREEKMIELKHENNELSKKLGLQQKYLLD